MAETAFDEAERFEKLQARVGIAPNEYTNAVEFNTRVHDRKLTPDELAFLREGLRARGRLEDRV